MAYDLAMLNRLRVNAGKSELTSWKAAKSLLREKIEELKAAGFVDALPGANIEAQPVTDDPEILEKLQEPAKKDDEGDDEAPKKEKVTKVKAQLARGIETDGYAKHSRKAVQDHRRDERKEAKEERKKVKLDDKDKKQIKDEAEDRKKPSKEERQKKHIEEKRAKREKEGKLKPAKEKNDDEVTVAQLARELEIDPKIARAKLRRYEDKKDYPKPVKGERWTFPKAAAKQLKAILKGSK